MARHYTIRLFKIKSNHKNVRTDIVEGVCRELPQIGTDFLMSGPGLKFGTRLVQTTPIKALARVGDSILFETNNSTYAISIEGEFDDEAQKTP